MKHLFLFVAFASTVLLSSCHYDDDVVIENPPLLGQVFETTVDFNSNNSYSRVINFPDIEVFESDVVLVYLLEDVVSDGQGGSFDVWSQLPQTFFTQDGTLIYNFDHTFVDVRLFQEANFDLNLLGSEFTNDQTFRIAVLPAEFASDDLTMEELLETIEFNSTNIKTIE